MDFDRRAFWADPANAPEHLKKVDGGKFYKFAQPEFYLKNRYSLAMIGKYIPKYTRPRDSLLEYGCNTGKCMAMLTRDFGYSVTGIEINQHAVDLGLQTFKELKPENFIVNPLEDVVTNLPEFDGIYGNGVLMHLPYELDWVIETLVSKARSFFFTSENEQDTNFQKFARNYREFIEPLGWTQVEEEGGENYPPLPASTIIRCFVR